MELSLYADEPYCCINRYEHLGQTLLDRKSNRVNLLILNPVVAIIHMTETHVMAEIPRWIVNI